MKNKIAVALLGFLIIFSQAFAQSTLWARQNSNGNCNVVNIGTDVAGYVYMTGWYDNKISFGFDTLSCDSNQNGNFLVKYDSLGNLIWAKNCGIPYTTGDSIGSYQTAFCSSGNLYIIGATKDTVATFSTLTLHKNSGTNEIGYYLAKYDTAGNIIWAKSLQYGENTVYYWNIALDKNDNIYCTATGNNLTGNLIFGADTLINKNFFIAKLDSTGNPIWSKGGKAKKQYVDQYYAGYGIYAITVGKFGNIYRWRDIRLDKI